ncbi:hypothetical protein [Flavobacterium panici]|uniref:hypothetical protein n=1 Tax=Flavobacterium panici TaxID=2654843 RepID=UPI0015DFB842|nr:hypothetical protein [Flavobacterium panici]
MATFSARSQVGIGTKSPNASAQLEVTTNEKDPYGNSTKGILIPRVTLEKTTQFGPIEGDPTKSNSLLVFNIKEQNDVTPGYYYWYVDRWMRFAVSGEAGSGTGKNGMDGIPGTR